MARPVGIIVGGTGAAVAPLRFIAAQWSTHRPEADAVTVPASLGTTGGLRALAQEGIDVAASARPLTDEEMARGWRQKELATSILVFAARTPIPNLTTEQVRAIWRSEMREGPGGRRVVPLRREATDGGLAIIRRWDTDLASDLAPSKDVEPATVLHTDQRMRDALLEVDGAIGWISLGMIRLEGLPLHPIALNGAAPTPDALARGEYPLSQPIYLVWREGDARAEVFVAFATQPEMQRQLERRGYLAR